MMTVMELKREDIFRLINLMRQTDGVLYEAHCNWENCTSVKGFAPVKAATVLWGRISETLGFSRYGCTEGMPSFSDEDMVNDINMALGDSIADYIMSSYDLSEPSTAILEKAGISLENDFIDPTEFNSCKEVHEEEALEQGEELDKGELMARTLAYFKESYCMSVANELPEFYRSLIEFVCENEFYADVYFMKSKRIGRFEKAKGLLREKLPVDLYEGISFLIRSVFMPLYIFFPDLVTDGVNDKGEYYSVYTLGDFIDSAEEVEEIHRFPYADVAVALLDRLMAEAEALVPELLSGNDAADSKNSEAVTVNQAVCAA